MGAAVDVNHIIGETSGNSQSKPNPREQPLRGGENTFLDSLNLMNHPHSHDEEHPESAGFAEDTSDEPPTGENPTSIDDSQQGDEPAAEDSPDSTQSSSTTSHWQSLVEEIGATAAPQAARQHAARELPASQEKPKREAAKPRSAPAAPGRKHWAGLAGELGVDFPDLPPEEEDTASEDVTPEAADAETATSEHEVGATKSKGDSPQIIPVPPEDLIEDTPAAVSEMLDEVEEPDLFGGGLEAELDPAEEEAADDDAADDDAAERAPAADLIEHEAHSQSDADEMVYAEAIDVSEEEAADSSDDGDDEDEEERPRRRRGRRRGRRRRRSDSGDAKSREDDAADDDVADEDETDDVESDASDDESDDDDDRPRRRRGRRDGRSRGGDGKRDYKFPMWSEAIDLLVTKNMEGRKSGKGDGGSRRGGRGRRRR